MSTSKQVMSVYLEDQNVQWIKTLSEKFDRPTSFVINFMIKAFKENPQVIDKMLSKQDLSIASLMEIYNDPEEKDYPLK